MTGHLKKNRYEVWRAWTVWIAVARDCMDRWEGRPLAHARRRGRWRTLRREAGEVGEMSWRANASPIFGADRGQGRRVAPHRRPTCVAASSYATPGSLVVTACTRTRSPHSRRCSLEVGSTVPHTTWRQTALTLGSTTSVDLRSTKCFLLVFFTQQRQQTALTPSQHACSTSARFSNSVHFISIYY
jgi:hypothetical protein